MYQAVERCAPKPVLSTYPSAIAAPPAAQTARHTALQTSRRLTAVSSAVLQPARHATAAVLTWHISSSGLSTEAAAGRSNDDRVAHDSGSGSSSRHIAAAKQAASSQLRGACALLSESEEKPIIRICTGDFSGGPNQGVFRFAGQLLLPRGRAVRVPFAAGTSQLPKRLHILPMPECSRHSTAWRRIMHGCHCLIPQLTFDWFCSRLHVCIWPGA